MRLNCDNKSAINSAILQDRTKHVEVGTQFIKEKLDNWIMGQYVYHFYPLEMNLQMY